MKKQVLAAAVSAVFVGPALAQNVQLYGSFDTGYSTQETKSTSTSTSRLSSDNKGFNAVGAPITSSRIGIRGSEDMGGGLKANFNWETDLTAGTGALASSTATITALTRTSIVGLSGGFGSINFGRALTGIHGVVAGFNGVLAGSNSVGDVIYSGAMRAHQINSSTWGAGTTTASAFNSPYSSTVDPLISTTNTTQGVDGVRRNNMLSYTTPTLNGFSARVDYSKDDRNADTANAVDKNRNDQALGLRLDYAGGPLKVALGSQSIKMKAAQVAGTTTVFANFTVTGGTIAGINTSVCSSSTGTICQTLTAGTAAITSANDDSKLTTNAISAAYDFGFIAVDASYASNKYNIEGQGDLYRSNGWRLGVVYPAGPFKIAAAYGEGSVKNATEKTADRKAYQLVVTYDLSKRTNLYALYGYQEQRSISNDNKIEVDQVSLGLRHSF